MIGPLLMGFPRLACHSGSPVACIQGYEIRRRIACEDQIACCTQHAIMPRSAFPLVAPANLPGLVIDRLHHAFGKSTAIVSAPAFRLVVIVVDVVHAARARGVDVEQAGIGTETRRRPVVRAALVR